MTSFPACQVQTDVEILDDIPLTADISKNTENKKVELFKKGQ